MKKEKSDIEKMRDILENGVDRLRRGDNIDEIRKEVSGSILKEKLTIKDDEKSSLHAIR